MYYNFDTSTASSWQKLCSEEHELRTTNLECYI